MEEGCDIGDLLRGGGKRGHAFVRAAVADDFADEVAVDVVSDERGSDEIRATGARGIRTVAKTAGLLELLAATVDGGTLFG